MGNTKENVGHTYDMRGGELLAEIKKYMDLNNIKMQDLAVNMNKSQQSVSQMFKTGNPQCNTLFDICKSLNIQLDINLINKSDTTF